MPIPFHPLQGSIVTVNFDAAFREPEIVKPRPCVVLSKPSKASPGLCLVLALSTTAPRRVMPWHCEIQIPFSLSRKWGQDCWVKGDMIYAVGFQRINLIDIGKDRQGKRIYQLQALPEGLFASVQACVRAALDL